MRRALRHTMLAVALTLATHPARAEDAAAIEQAKMMFDAGAQAYAATRYAQAIKAFEAAYKLAPRPALLFSLAQAERKQYIAEHDNDTLRRAVTHYRDYLKQVPTGGRRQDAVDALGELEPAYNRLEATSPNTPTPPPTQPAARPQLMVSSKTPGAMLSLDGGPAAPPPLIEDVKPGTHKVHVSAPGFYDEDRDIPVSDKGSVPTEVTLRERPAIVTLRTQDGADVAIDGRPVATTPLPRPLELPSGAHLLTITKNGHKPFTKDLSLERGSAIIVEAPLESTGQRVVSYVVLGAGAAAVVTGIVFSVGAAIEARKAQDVLDIKAHSNISPQQLDDYNSAVSHRDTWRTGAIASLGGGVAVLAVGGILYAFDHPSVTAPVPERGGPKPNGPQLPAKDNMEVRLVPLFTPGVTGASLTGRF